MADSESKLVVKDVFQLIQEDWVWDILVTTISPIWDRTSIKKDTIKQVDDEVYIQRYDKMYAILTPRETHKYMTTFVETLCYIKELLAKPQHIFNGTHPAKLLCGHSNDALKASIREKFMVKKYKQLEEKLAGAEKKLVEIEETKPEIEKTKDPVERETIIQLYGNIVINNPLYGFYMYDISTNYSWYNVTIYNEKTNYNNPYNGSCLGHPGSLITEGATLFYQNNGFEIYIKGANDAKIAEIKTKYGLS